MMEASRRSSWEALDSFLLFLQERMRRWGGSGDSTTIGKIWNLLGGPSAARFLSDKVLLQYRPEICFLVMYVVERNMLLSNASSSFFESLYGGKRVKLDSPKADDRGQRKLLPIPRRDSVMLSLLFPLGYYLLERTEAINNVLSNNSTSNVRLPPRVKKLFRYLYPFLCASGKGLHLLEKWRFLLGRSVFFDWYSRWMNLVVRRVAVNDATPENGVTTKSDAADLQTLVYSALKSPKFRRIGLGFLFSAIGTSWIARLQSMRQNLRQQRLLKDPGFAPPPPKAPVSRSSSLLLCPQTHCPLCRQPRINPAASTGGYVFCLSCLTTFVRSTPACPITGKACPESRIIRLFEPQSV